MGKTVVFLSVAVLVLLIVVSLQLPQAREAEKRTADAQELAGAVKQLLNVIDVRCTARASDFLAIKDCITPALTANEFSTDIFRPFNERKNESGVFVIKNEGAKSYNGSSFVLSKNGEDVFSGCHISGEILTDYTCRFDLPEPCSEGDVFEITYNAEEPVRLVTKTC